MMEKNSYFLFCHLEMRRAVFDIHHTDQDVRSISGIYSFQKPCYKLKNVLLFLCLYQLQTALHSDCEKLAGIDKEV